MGITLGLFYLSVKVFLDIDRRKQHMTSALLKFRCGPFRTLAAEARRSEFVDWFTNLFAFEVQYRI